MCRNNAAKQRLDGDRAEDPVATDMHIWLALLLILTLVHGLIYSLVIPPWQAPDEPGHFEYAWLIAHLGRLPTQQDLSPAFEQELLWSLYEWRYGEYIGRPLPEEMPARLDDLPSRIHVQRSRPIKGDRFSLSYAWQAIWLFPVRSQDLTLQLRICRFSSVLLNVGIIWLALKTFLELLPPSRRYLAWAMVAVVVLLPQHTFINSMVGDGPLAELMACLVLYCWARLFRRGITVWTVAGIVLGTVAGIWAKFTAAFLLPVDLALALWWLVRQLRGAWSRRQAACLGAGLVVLALATWALTRLPSPLTPSRLIAAWNSLSPDRLLWVDVRGITFGNALLYTHDSFWANFGWMNVPVSTRWYGALLLLIGAAVLGWLLGAKERDAHPPWAAKMMWGSLLAALAAYVWEQLLTQSSGYYQYQGRYLFPAIIPFAFLLVGGWSRIVPSQQLKLVIGSVVLFLALFDGWCIVGYLLPLYST